jgi:hypothetical protein
MNGAGMRPMAATAADNCGQCSLEGPNALGAAGLLAARARGPVRPGDWAGGVFGGFVAALLSIPCAAALQVIVREIWRGTALFPPRAFRYRPRQ